MVLHQVIGLGRPNSVRPQRIDEVAADLHSITYWQRQRAQLLRAQRPSNASRCVQGCISQPEVEGNKNVPSPDRNGAEARVGRCRSGVWQQCLEGPFTHLRQVTARAHIENRWPQARRGPARQMHRELLWHRRMARAVLRQRYKRHNVDDPKARVNAGVGARSDRSEATSVRRRTSPST